MSKYISINNSKNNSKNYDFSENLSINIKVHPDDEMMNNRKRRNKPEVGYFRQGKRDAFFFRDGIKRHRPDLLKDKKLLEFGCGHGRVARHLRYLLNPSQFYVADLFDSAVNFCADEFNAIPFLISKKNPISQIKTKFDLILSYSVFSHLPPASFEENLRQLWTILDKDGLLLFSVTNEQVAIKKGISLEKGYNFSDLKNETSGRLSPADYGFMNVSESFVRTILNKIGFRLLEFAKRDIRQDVFIVQKI